jgi:predicted transcriptional regulator
MKRPRAERPSPPLPGNAPPSTPAPPAHRLTQVELELMTVLWRLESGTVADVIENLPAGRELAYTSVSTILRILEKKVESRKQGRGHLYVPLVRKDAYEAWTVQDLVTRLFDGAPAALVRTLIASERLSPADRRAIRELLDGRRSR